MRGHQSDARRQVAVRPLGELREARSVTCSSGGAFVSAGLPGREGISAAPFFLREMKVVHGMLNSTQVFVMHDGDAKSF